MASTRDAIGRAALELFERHGFDAVSVADVADAAGVSERTVFRYFPTKEQLALGDVDHFDGFIDALRHAPDELSIAEAITYTTTQFLPASEADTADDARRSELVRSTPSVHRAWIAQLEAAEPRIAAWVSERAGVAAGSLETRVAARALVAVHRLTVESWTSGDIGDYVDTLRRALAVVSDGLDELGRGVSATTSTASPASRA